MGSGEPAVGHGGKHLEGTLSPAAALRGDSQGQKRRGAIRKAAHRKRQDTEEAWESPWAPYLHDSFIEGEAGTRLGGGVVAGNPACSFPPP